MTPTQQKSTTKYLETVRSYLEMLVSGTVSVDEDFVPELAGMAERVGVILSAVRAGFYTTNPQPVPASNVSKGIKLDASMRGYDEYADELTSYPIVDNWQCCECNKMLRIGDYVNNTTNNLRHIDCERPQG